MTQYNRKHWERLYFEVDVGHDWGTYFVSRRDLGSLEPGKRISVRFDDGYTPPQNQREMSVIIQEIRWNAGGRTYAARRH